MFRIDDMRVFSAVVEAQSFTNAARLLELSRAQVSKRINALESGLGVRLLNRTTRRLSLTEAGQLFYASCVDVTNIANAATESLKEITLKPAGTLRVSMPILFGEDIFTPMISELLARYPDLGLRMDFTDGPVDLIHRGYDVGIEWIGPLPSSGLIAKKLTPFDVTVSATAAYYEKYGVPKTPFELKRHNCLIYTPLRKGPEIWSFHDPAGGEFEISVAGTIEANHARPLLESAKKGLGLLYAPKFMIRRELASGILIPALEAYSSRAMGIYALYPHRNLPLKTRVFLDFVSEKIKAYRWQ